MENQCALLEYEQTGYKEITGWMGAGLFPLLQLCNSTQEAMSEKGGAVEIGVHHGQFFIALNQLCKADELSLAIDVFDAQHLNIDGSGAGSLQHFKENLSKYCCHAGRNVTILAKDSTTLRPADILGELLTRPRLFSIDGGHTVEHTMHDLALANECISDFGVIFLDDILNPQWLGVVEGVCRYLMRSPTIFPFAINSNKLFLCRMSAYKYYLQAFSEFSVPPQRAELFGKTVLVW
jgi:hypothetical protein